MIIPIQSNFVVNQNKKNQINPIKSNHHVSSIRHIDFVWGDGQAGFL